MNPNPHTKPNTMNTEAPKLIALETIEALYAELGREHRRHAWENSDWIALSDFDIEALDEQQVAGGRIPSEGSLQWFWKNFLLPLRPQLARETQGGGWAVWWPRASMRTADLIAALDDRLGTADAHARLLSSPQGSEDAHGLRQNFLRAIPLALELRFRFENLDMRNLAAQVRLDELRVAIGQQRNDATSEAVSAPTTEPTLV